MDRLGVRAALVAMALAAGCTAENPRIVARGTLAYAAAWRGERLITIELIERFQLVVRDGSGLEATARIDLGPPEVDLSALAVAGDVAVVGGRDGWIRRFDLDAERELDRWPQGAPLTALAATAELVLAGDAGGALCVRRTSGELLQCVAHAEVPITRISVSGNRATVVAGRTARVLEVPSLRVLDGPGVTVAWEGGAVTWRDRAVVWSGPRGRRRLATLAGPVRSVAASDGGKLAIAGWVKALDQPSVIVWTAPPR